MCGRYYLKTPPAQLAIRFNLESLETEVLPRENISPTQTIPVILNESPKVLSDARWGLIPFWAKDDKIGAKMINARAEGVAEKPSFRSAFKRRRCLIPSDGFYEWRTNPVGPKTPIQFSLATGEAFAFAGLWEIWRPSVGEAVRSCTIITTEANDLVAPVHDRMPVLLRREDEAVWLDTAENPAIALALLRPFPAHEMIAADVTEGPLVNRKSPPPSLPL